MRARTKRLAVLVLLGGPAAAVGGVPAMSGGAAVERAHSCYRLEVYVPVSSTIVGSSGCTLHQDPGGGHVCAGQDNFVVGSAVFCKG